MKNSSAIAANRSKSSQSYTAKSWFHKQPSDDESCSELCKIIQSTLETILNVDGGDLCWHISARKLSKARRENNSRIMDDNRHELSSKNSAEIASFFFVERRGKNGSAIKERRQINCKQREKRTHCTTVFFIYDDAWHVYEWESEAQREPLKRVHELYVTNSSCCCSVSAFSLAFIRLTPFEFHE